MIILKDLKLKDIIYQKQLLIIITSLSFYDQPLDSDIKRYKGIRILTTGQGEDYTTGGLLDYDHIKKSL